MTLVREASGEAAKNDLPGVFGAPDPGTNEGTGEGRALPRTLSGVHLPPCAVASPSSWRPASWSAFRTPSFRSPTMTFSAADSAVVMAWPRFR